MRANSVLKFWIQKSYNFNTVIPKEKFPFHHRNNLMEQKFILKLYDQFKPSQKYIWRT